MKGRWTLLVVAICLVLVGCEKAHPSRQTVEGVMEALKYRDAERLFGYHLDSTPRGFYCESKDFQELLARSQQARNPKECARVRALRAKDVEEVPDEARLLVQVLRFACEHPEADCVDYGREVFESQLTHSGLLERTLGKWEIQKIVGDEARAVAYVDLHFEGQPVEHRSLALRKDGERWYVAEGLLVQEGSR